MHPDYPGAVPMLVYRDAPAAIDFLCKAFGFETGVRMDMPDGSVAHCELRRGQVVIMLSSEFSGLGLRSAQSFEGRYSQVMLYVADVDDHHQQALCAGATVTQPPQDQPHGARMYRAEDPEGHRWLVSQHVKNVPPEEWMQAMGAS